MKLFGYAFDTPLVAAHARRGRLRARGRARRRPSAGPRFGRQLVAIRDSEAACATFGLNLIWPRLGVFMLSAGIAGLGGALYGMQLGAISPERFNLVAGLPIFVLVVVGGAGLVGGALFAGIASTASCRSRRPWARRSRRSTRSRPASTGIGLGRNPSGVVPLMSEGVAPVRKDRPVLLGMFGAMVAVYVLRRLDVYGNWPFVILLFACLVVANAIAERRVQARARAAGEAVEEEPVDLEWVGITTPWTADRLAEVDSALKLDGFAAALAADGEDARARA